MRELRMSGSVGAPEGNDRGDLPPAEAIAKGKRLGSRMRGACQEVPCA